MMDKETLSATPSGSLLEKWLGPLLVYSLAISFFRLDQWSKQFIALHYNLYESHPILSPWLYFTHVRNDGAAFSTFKGQMVWLSVIAIIVSLGIIWYERHLPSRRPSLISVSLGFLLGGALGNLLDRLSLQYVIDFIDLHYHGRNIWPIFNVADMCINMGVGLLILYFILYPEKNKNQDTNKQQQASQP